MEGGSWGFMSSSSERERIAAARSRLAAFRSEEVDGEENEAWTGYACPFCYEEFDVIGLCFHFDDQHPVEANREVCPICPERVGIDLVSHITTEHANFYKRRRSQKGSSASQTMFSSLSKNLRQGNIQSSFGGSSFTSAPSNSAPDPLISSFILNVPAIELLKEEQSEQSKSFEEGCEINELVEEVKSHESSISLEYEKERASRNEFVRGLVLCTIFEDTQ